MDPGPDPDSDSDPVPDSTWPNSSGSAGRIWIQNMHRKYEKLRKALGAGCI